MKKLMNKKGFTLMEMLIVVAIIAILVAVSVPAFTASLDDAKVATDNANLRSAKSAAQIYVIDHTVTDTQTFYYDIASGEIKEYTTTEPAACGESSANADKFIKITYTSSKPEVKWD